MEDTVGTHYIWFKEESISHALFFSLDVMQMLPLRCCKISIYYRRVSVFMGLFETRLILTIHPNMRACEWSTHCQTDTWIINHLLSTAQLPLTRHFPHMHECRVCRVIIHINKTHFNTGLRLRLGWCTVYRLMGWAINK